MNRTVLMVITVVMGYLTMMALLRGDWLGVVLYGGCTYLNASNFR